ncbi:glycosyltransferase family 2 protein [Streptomyces sp. NPDC001339]|uniref:glycosyltransferase family 2 protein n=1 Tax=Streptomyces sp. NPDC001339 TaxID=3364563 RepID=UPI003681EF57
MNLVGCMLVRNEAWVLDCSVRAALRWCDRVVVVDHASTDDTPELLRRIRAEVGADRLRIESWPDPSRWDEMAQRQRLLELAREVGATHCALVDADEVLTANLLPHIRGWIEALAPGQVLDLPLIPVWRDLYHFRDDESEWCRHFVSIAVADRPNLHWTPAPGDGYQHHHRAPRGAVGGMVPTPVVAWEGGGLMHLQWACWERLLWKHRVYKMFEQLRWPDRQRVAELDAKYSRALDERGIRRSKVPDGWWKGHRPELIDLDHTPWYVEECRRLWTENGPEAFAGLNLWGWPADAH